MQWSITEVVPVQEYWQAYLDHLARANMLHSATNRGEAKPDCYYLGILLENGIVGHLALRKQSILVPASYLCENREVILTDHGAAPLYETFVQSFAVEPQHRRQGYGRALQEAALEKTRAAGCYQMRSWSSADKRENYALKISLGFAVQPALYPMPGGPPISGVYFIKRV